MTCTRTVSEAERIIERWITQASEIIESVTGVTAENDDLLSELADCEWIYCGGFAGDDEEVIDMESALRQLSFIVERWIDNFKAEQAELAIDAADPATYN